MLHDTVVDAPPMPPTQRASSALTQNLVALYPSTRRILVGAAQTVTYTMGAYAGLGALGLMLSQLTGTVTLGGALLLGYGSASALALGRMLLSLRTAHRGPAAALPIPIEHEFSGTRTAIDWSPAGARATAGLALPRSPRGRIE